MAQQYCVGPVMMIDWVLAADQLLVMNLGLTVEPSTHRRLVEQDRLYATLHERQFRATADTDELTAIGA